MTVTFKKLAAGVYAIHINGQPSSLNISKDTAPKRWGEPQQWDVIDLAPEGPFGGDYLFTVKGLDDAKRIFSRLSRAYGAPFLESV